MVNRNIIEDLLLEVSVYHPIINFQEKEQVETLLWICEQKGYTNLIPFIKESFLNEEEDGKESKLFPGHFHLGGGYYAMSKDGDAVKKSENGKLRTLTPKEKQEKNAEKTKQIVAPITPSPSSEDEIESDLPPALKPSTSLSPVQRKGKEDEETPEDKANGEHETAIEEPEKILNDPKASMRSKAVARSQQSKNAAIDAELPNKDAKVKGEYKPDPELKPKVDDKGNVEGTDIPATVKENPDPEFVNKVATKMDDFYDDVLKEEERAQSAIIEKMKDEGKLPKDFKVVHPMPFGFKHPDLKNNPELQKELADRIKKENKPPHWNLCKVSIPGTNKFCDENIGIPREKMPQLGGKPKPGSAGEAKAKRVADQNVRKKMGIGIDTPIPPTRQDEYDELFAKENIAHVNVEQEFEDYLQSEGISVSEAVEVPAASLKATQSELVGEQVVGMIASLEEDPNNPFITAPIMVTHDGYVIDGHHRWAAIQGYNMKNSPPNGNKPPIQMKVRIVGEDIETHIPRANAFAEKMGIETMSGKAKGGVEKAEPVAAQKVSEPEEKKTEKPKDGDSFSKGTREFKPKEEPKVTDDKIGKKAVTQNGKILYHIGGGYYSDSPGGAAKYIRTESVIERAIENDSLEWWSLLFEADIKASVEGGKEGTFRPIAKGEQDAATIQAQQSVKQIQPTDSESEESDLESEAESEEAVEIDLDKLSKTAKKRESSLDENEKTKLNNLRNKLYKDKVSKIKDKPKGIKEALRKAINNEPLTKQEKILLNDYVRIVEPTSKKPNTFRIYLAKEPGNFEQKTNVDFTGDSPEGALIRDVMGANGVKNIATSAFGGKKSTAAQMYVDESGNTRVLKPQPKVETDQQSGKINSIAFGNMTLERLDENEEGISPEEKLRRERSNRNLDEFGKQIANGTLKFVDTDSGRYPDTAENRSFIIKDSLIKMHDKLLAMAQKAGARPGSEAMKLLDRLKKLSTLNPNQNPEDWYKEYNDLFHDIAESKEEPKLGESWANIAEIWVTLGEMQGKGKGTEEGIIALLPESTTLETVDVIKLGKNTDEANRTIVTIDGISVKKEAGGASAMVPKMRKTSFKDLDGSDGKTFKDEITGFGAKGAGSIYGYPNTLEEAKKECSKWSNYEQPAKDGKKKKKPKISKDNCDIVNQFKNETQYVKHVVKHQSNYQNEMASQSNQWEESGRLPKGYTKTILAQMKAQSEKGGAIYNALEAIKSKNPIYKKLKGKEKALWEAQMLTKLKNYYLHIYISHAAYNQNVESQDFENDSVYAKTDKESGEGKIEIHKSDGVQSISFMNPAFNVGWNASGTPSNFAAGRLVPLNRNDEEGRNFGIPSKKSNKPVSDKKSKTTAKKPVKPTKKKSVREMIQSLPTHIKERIANRLKEQNDEMNSKVEKLKELVRQRVRK